MPDSLLAKMNKIIKQEISLTSNFLPTKNLEFTTNIPSPFKMLFKPSQFNNTIRYILVMKKPAITISSIDY